MSLAILSNATDASVTGVFYKWMRMCVISSDSNTITVVARIYAKGALP